MISKSQVVLNLTHYLPVRRVYMWREEGIDPIGPRNKHRIRGGGRTTPPTCSTEPHSSTYTTQLHPCQQIPDWNPPITGLKLFLFKFCKTLASRISTKRVEIKEGTTRVHPLT